MTYYHIQDGRSIYQKVADVNNPETSKYIKEILQFIKDRPFNTKFTIVTNIYGRKSNYGFALVSRLVNDGQVFQNDMGTLKGRWTYTITDEGKRCLGC